MAGGALHSGLRELRIKAGLQQRELAARVGVTRQTLGALEAGDSVPATSIALQLARVLGCRVEDIFWLGEDAAPVDALLVARPDEDEATPSARRRVALAVIGGGDTQDGQQQRERWVAHVMDGVGTGAFATPADGVLVGPLRRDAGTRAGRKPATGPATAPLPPVSLRVRPLRESRELRENLFAAGCDPALALLAGHVAERWKAGRLHWLEAGSGAAMDMMADRAVHLAGVHLYDEESGDYNVAPVRRRLGGRALLLVNLATWEQGLVVAAGNPKQLRGVADLARKGVRVVGREAGSGSQELLARLAAEAGVPRKAVAPVAVARGHLAVAQAVAAGAADAGIATRAAAASQGLAFVPLAEARFDLVVPRESATEARLQRLFEVLASQRFKRDLGSLAGYGTARTGQVVAELAA
jgi:putative molybdopterin biosynthesis protein